MSDPRIIVFRSRLRPGVDADYGSHAEQMFALAERAPGYVSAKDFTAEDGERLALIEWSSPGELRAWRELPEHAAAQARGRERYYASYDLRVCSEVRSSKFDGASVVRADRDPAGLRAIAENWLAAFARRDLDALLALYSDDAIHTTPKLREKSLRGKAAMRDWWQRAFDRLPSLRYVPTAITADSRRVFMEYVRKVDGEPDLAVAEVLEVEGGLVVASRVFHG